MGSGPVREGGRPVQPVQWEEYRPVYTRTQSGLTSMQVTPARQTEISILLKYSHFSITEQSGETRRE